MREERGRGGEKGEIVTQKKGCGDRWGESGREVRDRESERERNKIE